MPGIAESLEEIRYDKMTFGTKPSISDCSFGLLTPSANSKVLHLSNTIMIQPRTLQGFRDFLPETMIPRETLIETAKSVYRSYGFSPIDTPALELDEILGGKGGEETEKQRYRFEDQGGRLVGMRFDLTIPLARFVAQHANELVFPFKRYAIAKVWRGERPQKGRYREFMQCDFDTVGTDSVQSDIETTLVISDLMRAIGFEKFTVQLNNRKVLNGLLDQLGLQNKLTEILRALDKIAKVERDVVIREMVEKAETSEENAAKVLELADLTGTNDELLEKLKPLVGESQIGAEGLDELTQVNRVIKAMKLESNVKINVSIARGLDYYTGTVYETFLDDLPKIGSVCSGGRYDNLAGLFTKQTLPGVGASLGLDRLLAAMEELNMIDQTKTTAPVLVVFFDKDRGIEYQQIAAVLRSNGIGAEVFPQAKKMGQQLKYAERRGFRFAIIAGDQEFESQQVQLKLLDKRQQLEISTKGDYKELVAAIQSEM